MNQKLDYFVPVEAGDTTMEILDQSNNLLFINVYLQIFYYRNILLKLKALLIEKNFLEVKSRALVYMKHTLQCRVLNLLMKDQYNVV